MEYADRQSAMESAKAEIKSLLADGVSEGDTAFIYRYIEAADITIGYYRRRDGQEYWLLVDEHSSSLDVLIESITALHNPGWDFALPNCVQALDAHLEDCDCEDLHE